MNALDKKILILAKENKIRAIKVKWNGWDKGVKESKIYVEKLINDNPTFLKTVTKKQSNKMLSTCKCITWNQNKS